MGTINLDNAEANASAALNKSLAYQASLRTQAPAPAPKVLPATTGQGFWTRLAQKGVGMVSKANIAHVTQNVEHPGNGPTVPKITNTKQLLQQNKAGIKATKTSQAAPGYDPKNVLKSAGKIAQTVPRSAVELGLSADPKQKTFTPGGKAEQLFLGKTPVQNIEKKAMNTYQTMQSQGKSKDTAKSIAAAEVVGSLVQDVPLIGSLFKGAGIVSKIARGEKTVSDVSKASDASNTIKQLGAGDTAKPKVLPQGEVVKTKALPAGSTGTKPTTTSVTEGKNAGVFGEGAKNAQAGTVQSRLDMVQKIDDQLAKVQQGKSLMGAQAQKDLFATRKALVAGSSDHLVGSSVKDTVQNIKNDNTKSFVIKDSGSVPKTNPLKVAASKSSAAKVDEPSLNVPVSKPKAPPAEKEPLVNDNAQVKSLVNKLTPNSLKGKLNPVDSAARQGHTTFAKQAFHIAQSKINALRQGNNTANEFDKLYANYKATGGTDQKFIKDVENGNLTSPAHKLWDQIHTQTGAQLSDLGITKGARSNYVSRVAQFIKKGFKQGGTGLSKSGSFAKGRATLNDEFGISHDKFASHADFKAAVEKDGGKVLSNPSDILRHTLPSKYEAIENAKGLNELDKTAMADGRPATSTFDASKGLPANIADYNKNLIPGRAVHPSAVNTIKSLTHTYTSGEINNPVARVNSVAKQIITLNGMIHGKNFGLASLRQQGLFHTAASVLRTNKDLATTFGEDNIQRAIVKGGVVPFEQAKQDLFDQLGNPGLNKTWNKAVSFPGKAIGAERNLLFNKLGNHLQFSTYFNVEKQMVKAGLSEDEAARVAGQAANKVGFISSPVKTSVEYSKGARMIFFAGQYFKSTLSELSTALGISRDSTLSRAAQGAAQKQAIKGIARGATYLLALAQGINYAVTGHSTFQNKDSKISPVFYIDKATGKEYHITNWYGQIGDMMHTVGNPIKELNNKTSPLLGEASRVGQALSSGAPDPYTGQTVIDKNAPGWRQTSQAVGNILENMITPAGFQLSQSQRSTPGMVNFAKTMGYGASTVDNNPMEKDILNQYYATLPSGASKTPPAQSVLEAAARNDLAHGRTNTGNLQQLQKTMSPTQFKTFMKTGADSTVQRAFDKLPTNQKLQVIEKYTPQQLKELDLTGVAKTLVGTSQKASVTSLETKGFSPQRITKDLQKVGINQSQLQQIRTEAKKQASATARKSAATPKFVNPLL